ncbi:hypothetical protein LPJ66_007369 [Kickxella alabastrina]|uniref:Uncharacterized protein n=1 Tax=Kickxella alabastrina TaxID=61397 RepID=A0ACC1IDC5_9FUNG|nr:hypothetical protein LPJ66_007369 [Kickxella alabastrina]
MGTQSSSGARFVKRSAVFPNDNASRYNSTGYPKSTRSIRSSDGTTGEMRPVSTHMSMDRPPSTYERPTSQSQTKLKGFQVRVINTHVGRTLVHAPILENSATETMQEDGPELPPLSAAELRYNAQRALINTTAVLRTAVGSKHANKGGGSKQPQQLLSAEVVNAHATYSSSSSSGKAKEKDMGKRQGSHRVSDKGYVTPPTSAIGGSSDYNDSSTGRTGTLLAEQSPKPGFTELNLGFTPELGQSPPMSGASVLDQWGISTAAQFGQQKHALQLEAARQERLLRGDDYGDDVDADQASDADSVTENAAWIVEQMASGCTPTLETMVRLLCSFFVYCA